MTSSCFRGFLSIAVLKALGDAPQSGYSLMKKMEAQVGSKPSAGSMYPLLDNLLERGLITVKEQGRSKEYSITKEGKKQLALIEEKRHECLGNIIESMKMLGAITGENMHFPLGMMQTLKAGKLPFKEIDPEWLRVRETLFTMMQDGTLKKHASRIKKILAQTGKELAAL